MVRTAKRSLKSVTCHFLWEELKPAGKRDVEVSVLRLFAEENFFHDFSQSRLLMGVFCNFRLINTCSVQLPTGVTASHPEEERSFELGK